MPQKWTTADRLGHASLLTQGSGLIGVLSVNAFHEKAGRSQVGSSFFSGHAVSPCRVATVAMLPFALSRSDSFARCRLGVLGSADAAICLAPWGSALGESNPGQAINAVTGTRLWLFIFSLPGTI